MKKAIIIHGWGATPLDWWFQKEADQLLKKGYEVFLPYMPDSLVPEQDRWVKEIKSLKPGKTSVLIGHSLGTVAILRYLEQANIGVDKVFLVAPFCRDLGLEFKPILNFVEKPFYWEKIKRRANHFYVITQRGDEWTPMDQGIEVAENLEADLDIAEGTDHLQESLDLELINRRV